jgi:hypothetical protein
VPGVNDRNALVCSDVDAGNVKLGAASVEMSVAGSVT